ncbi:MAG: sulfatase-like hydrolase/transferase [Verrucomicrobiae bacterium]|nr:sulfatase-like hydrolase/transferase [Verrucomicrobiae bacterium]
MRGLLILSQLLLGLLAIRPQAAEPRNRNVILVTVDGLRWQEVFRGAEEFLLNATNGGVTDVDRLRAAFWRATPEERRTALLPFFWGTIARQGQLYGNTNRGSRALVTNGRNFTYPGFNEIFTGFADDRIQSNAQRDNPNVTVFEWLHRKPAFAGRVAAFANWDTHFFIFNARRSGIPTWTGYTNTLAFPAGSRLAFLDELHQDITPVWAGMDFDVFYIHALIEYLKESQPRLAWLGLSEPDEWAHEGRYDHYLQSAHRMDRYLSKLWATVQSLPEYRDRTTLIVTADHGRGAGPSEWRNHGAAVEGAELIWIAALGPDTPALGERSDTAPVFQNQIAATIASLLGEDYRATEPRAGAPLPDVFGKAP